MGVVAQFDYIKKHSDCYGYYDLKWLNICKRDSPEIQMYWDIKSRLSGLLNLQCEGVLENYIRIFDCYSPFIAEELSVLKMILKNILRYAHWNQLYYKNMDDETLLSIVNKGIKKIQEQKKMLFMGEDFN
jgi:transcription termination factor NusB